MSLGSYRITGAALLALCSTSTAAQSDQRPSPYIEALGKCRAIGAPDQRADCYDKAYDALIAARARKDVVVMDREAVRETRKGLFGFTGLRLPFFGVGDDDDREVPKSVSSTIKSFVSLGYGHYAITLNEGGVWETTEGVSNFYPKVGQTVEVRRGAVTSYMLTIKGTGKLVRVRRVR